MKQLWTEILCDYCGENIDYVHGNLTKKMILQWVKSYREDEKVFTEGEKVFCSKECKDEFYKRGKK